MATLERAIAIAAKAHEGQTDKAGEAYIIHPLRVMLRMTGSEERMAAVLHDAVEDSPITLDMLRNEGFPESVVRAVDALTKRANENYEAFVARAALDPIGRKVKLADLLENSDLSRLSSPSEKDMARVEKYRKAIDFLRRQPAEYLIAGGLSAD
ncbi:HD domain-containing protein [Pseudomonas pohangensis]|uniref:HD domain-containing protein n=2 Tax=Pseudomonas pohangensis TaxID=364197 RepID=A0A1H2DWE9_9PSED|nr:HD domain-containing protein [Pseudomonas pohangensis]